MSRVSFKESEMELLLSFFTLESLQDAVFWVDSAGSIFQVNEKACSMSGYSKEELTSMRVPELNPSRIVSDFPKFWQRLKREKRITFEAQHKHKAGFLYDVEITGNYVEFKGQGFSCAIVRDLKQKKLEQQLLRDVSEATSALTGNDFLFELTKNITKVLNMRYAFITECTDETRTRFRTIAFVEKQNVLDNIEYDVEGSACSEMLKGEACFIPADVQKKFHGAKGIEAYVGVPIISPSTGEMLGHIAATDENPVTEDKNQTAILKIFAARAGAEIERIDAEKKLAKAYAELAKRVKEIEALKNQLQAENIYLQEEIKLNNNFEEIISKSHLFHKVLQQVEQVASTSATVLILGESGTGKELIARAIHNISNRSKRPLVKVNCATLPANLIESELFGHEKGAFTGAMERKIGRFELADGGTIFLDEIGELPVELQAKLLRVLQEGEFERLGNPKALKVDVRVIAATNRNLPAAIQKKEFREDLFYRLNVFPINCPPLRERKEDIALLVQHFLQKFEGKMGKKIVNVSPKVIEGLMSYDWPGNIRELENLIERAIILSPGNSLEYGEWLPVTTPASRTEKTKSSSKTLQDVEREHIIETLKKVNWKVSGEKGAARLLGLNSTTLDARMKKLGIRREES